MPAHIHFAETAQDLADWDRFVLECPCTSFFVTTSWLGSYTGYGMQLQWFLARDNRGKVVGGAPLATFRLGPFCWLSVPHGPACLPNAQDVLPPLLDGIEQVARRSRAIFLHVAPFEGAPHSQRWEERAQAAELSYDPDLPRGANCGAAVLLRARGYQQGIEFDLLKIPREGQIVRLDDGEVLDTFRKGTRRKIRHTLREGQIQVRQVDSIALLQLTYDLLKENVARYGGSIRPWPNFRSAIWPGIEHADKLVLLAFQNGEPCSTVVIGFGGRRAACIMAGNRRLDDSMLSPACLLQHVAMQETGRRGYPEYDLTALVSGGVAQFKRGFRPTYYRLVDPFCKVFRPWQMRVCLSAYPLLRKHRRRIARLVYRGRMLFARSGRKGALR